MGEVVIGRGLAVVVNIVPATCTMGLYFQVIISGMVFGLVVTNIRQTMLIISAHVLVTRSVTVEISGFEQLSEVSSTLEGSTFMAVVYVSIFGVVLGCILAIHISIVTLVLRGVGNTVPTIRIPDGDHEIKDLPILFRMVDQTARSEGGRTPSQIVSFQVIREQLFPNASSTDLDPSVVILHSISGTDPDCRVETVIDVHKAVFGEVPLRLITVYNGSRMVISSASVMNNPNLEPDD